MNFYIPPTRFHDGHLHRSSAAMTMPRYSLMVYNTNSVVRFIKSGHLCPCFLISGFKGYEIYHSKCCIYLVSYFLSQSLCFQRRKVHISRRLCQNRRFPGPNVPSPSIGCGILISLQVWPFICIRYPVSRSRAECSHDLELWRAGSRVLSVRDQARKVNNIYLCTCFCSLGWLNNKEQLRHLTKGTL